MHMVVRNELPICTRKRVQNYIRSELFAYGVAKPLQRLHVTNHFDHMRTQWITILKLAPQQSLRDLIPLSIRLSLEHSFEAFDHIVGLNMLELLFQVWFHVSKHKTANIRGLILSPTVGIGGSDSRILIQLIWSGLSRTWSFFSCLRTILRFRYQLVKLVSFSLSLSRMVLNAKSDI